jgi:xanthine dehydrogenase accessory factor
VASLGHDDESAVRRGLEVGCEYVGLIASRRRGAAVLEALRAAGVPEDDLARVRTPAGLAIGARTHAEIAVAILAEVVAVRRSPTLPSLATGGEERSTAAVAPSGGEARSTAAVAAGGEERSTAGGATAPTVREAIDPVCGMRVVVDTATPTAGGEAFCCDGCREAWLARAG